MIIVALSNSFSFSFSYYYLLIINYCPRASKTAVASYGVESLDATVSQDSPQSRAAKARCVGRLLPASQSLSTTPGLLPVPRRRVTSLLRFAWTASPHTSGRYFLPPAGTAGMTAGREANQWTAADGVQATKSCMLLRTYETLPHAHCVIRA